MAPLLWMRNAALRNKVQQQAGLISAFWQPCRDSAMLSAWAIPPQRRQPITDSLFLGLLPIGELVRLPPVARGPVFVPKATNVPLGRGAYQHIWQLCSCGAAHCGRHRAGAAAADQQQLACAQPRRYSCTQVAEANRAAISI